MFNVHIITAYEYAFLIFYTDTHDVDEDGMAVSNQGGNYGVVWAESKSGVFLRGMTNPASHSDPVVASKK